MYEKKPYDKQQRAKWNAHMNDTIVCESSLESQLIIHRIAMKNFLSLSFEQTL